MHKKIQSIKKILLWTVCVVAGVALNSCTSTQESNTKEQVDITTLGSITAFGIYFTSADSIRMQTFMELVKTKLPGFKRVLEVPDSATEDNFMIERYNNFTDDIAPPDVEYLSFAGEDLSEEEKLKLQNANSALVITFLSTQDNIIEKQRNITSFMGSLVQGKDNFIGDYNTRRYYSARSWKSKRVDVFTGNNMLEEIVMHTYREEEGYCRVVTLGMGKFCLPDISIKDFACSDQSTFGTLINSVVATWIQNPRINIDSTLMIDLQTIADQKVKEILTSDLRGGAEQKATIKLQAVEPEEGDNLNRQFKISFEDPSYAAPQEEQNAMLKKLFGLDESYVKVTHDEKILAASERAKSKLPELQLFFNKGLEPGYGLMVKAPFTTDAGGNEWMWVEITKWEGTTIEGILRNEPYEISTLKSGAQVIVRQEDVFDYILSKPDGSQEGNETGALLEEMN